VVQRVLDWVFNRRREEPDVPHCPDHRVPMQMRGVMGRPARFSYQTEETYTVIYFCAVPGCAETAEAVVSHTQIPVPGAAPRRPDFARQD
jgi:predicted enzyme related to lactoylglutathione lyase